MTDPDVERLLALAEEGLRRLGVSEGTIAARRKKTRAAIAARLKED